MLLPDPTTLRQQACWHAEPLLHEAENRRLVKGDPMVSLTDDDALSVSPRHLLVVALHQLSAALHWPPTSAHS